MNNISRACMKVIDACCLMVILCSLFGIERCLIRPFVSTSSARKIVDWCAGAGEEIVSKFEEKYN